MASTGKQKSILGTKGEYYILFRLAQEGILASKLPDIFDFDLLTNRHIGIEVKSACLQTRKQQHRHLDGTQKLEDVWSFANHNTKLLLQNGNRKLSFTKRERLCDFYAFVCFDNDGKNVIKTYIIPNDSLTKAQNIKIPKSGKSQMEEYLERWDLIVELHK